MDQPEKQPSSRELSPARQHFEKASATARAEAETPEVNNQARTQYERMLLLLDTHRQQLTKIQSLKAKQKHKLKLLPEYAAWVDGVLAAESTPQDDVFVTLMLWHFDCDQLSRAVDLAAVALGNNMIMPSRHHRTIGCVIAEEAALLSMREHADIPDEADLLDRVVSMVEPLDMPDEVRAKLFKALGFVLRKEGKNELALTAFETAVGLRDAVGVKKDIEALKRTIKNQQQPITTPSAAAD